MLCVFSQGYMRHYLKKRKEGEKEGEKGGRKGFRYSSGISVWLGSSGQESCKGKGCWSAGSY